MAAEFEIVVQQPLTVEVYENQTNIEVTTVEGPTVEVGSGVPQQNLWVTEEYPGFSGPGLWIQTGINGDPEAVTINLVYDDGT